LNPETIELPRIKLTGYQNVSDENLSKGVTPECFNGGSSSALAWIPIEAFGN